MRSTQSDHGNEIVKAALIILLALSVTTAHAVPPEVQEESCERVREQIQAHTGIPAKPDTVLLAKVGANRQCRFTSAEAYRAAWGDKPLPRDDQSHRRSREHEHDDD